MEVRDGAYYIKIILRMQCLVGNRELVLYKCGIRRADCETPKLRRPFGFVLR